MRIINVITTNNMNDIADINSFAIIDEKESGIVVEQAEEAFREAIVAIRHEDVTTEEADELRDEINENWLDEGYYEVGDDQDTKVFLVWSYADNVQY